MDFPYVLDTKAGFNLSIDKLTKEDIDEIIQIAAFKEMKYGFIWKDNRIEFVSTMLLHVQVNNMVDILYSLSII